LADFVRTDIHLVNQSVCPPDLSAEEFAVQLLPFLRESNEPGPPMDRIVEVLDDTFRLKKALTRDPRRPGRLHHRPVRSWLTVATHFEDVAPEELMRRMEELQTQA
jgi:hypothetical protein